MRKLFLLSGILLLFPYCLVLTSGNTPVNRQRPFDSGWKFTKGEISGAENPAFDDSRWRAIDLPHDWSIEDMPGPQGENQIGPFLKRTNMGWLTGHTTAGTGWYRKSFTLDKSDKGKSVEVLFDGIMAESDVWINGKHLGYHPCGYTAFACDLTPYLNPAGQPNVLAVKVVNNINSHRWYSGSGIYRNVSLIVTNPVHIDLWGVYVIAPEVSEEKAVVSLQVKIVNRSQKDASVKIRSRLVGKTGNIAGVAESTAKVQAGGVSESSQTITVSNPALWSADNPNLYMVEVDLFAGRKKIDTYTVETGIRSIKWDAVKGLQINGQTVKLRGGNIHHDNGVLGAAAFSRAEFRKIEILKANGFNAIRCSHNPPSSEFLKACDRIGMYVIDESFDAWEKAKVPGDYSRFFKEYWQKDMESMLMRDRNHPSIVIWSIGNEIMERADPSGLDITRKLVDFIKKYDSTRPVTEVIQGFSGAFGGVHTSWDDSAPAYAMLDIAGYNYSWREWESDHKKYPGRVMMTTESSAIDMHRVFTLMEKYPWIIGDFTWTGMDYFGESGCGAGYMDDEDINYGIKVPGMKKGYGRGWPWFSAWCGDIDFIGFRKPRMHYRDVLWRRSPLEMTVHLPVNAGRKEFMGDQGWPQELACWTWPGEEGKTLEVVVYTRCDSVRLELNGKVIGLKPVLTDTDNNSSSTVTEQAINQLVARFDVPYAPGELKALGITDGKEVATKVLKTLGKPARLVLTPDRKTVNADRNDLAFITVEVVDENGEKIQNAEVQVDFTISGNGEMAGTGNGAPGRMYSFQQHVCRTHNGKALIVIRPFARPGKIIITADGNGLISKTVEVTVE